jgi:hypothetical protein
MTIAFDASMVAVNQSRNEATIRVVAEAPHDPDGDVVRTSRRRIGDVGTGSVGHQAQW